MLVTVFTSRKAQQSLPAAQIKNLAIDNLFVAATTIPDPKPSSLASIGHCSSWKSTITDR